MTDAATVSLVSLDDRIASAFAQPTTPADLLALIAEVRAELDSSAKLAERVKSIALDPGLSTSAARKARLRMENAVFRHERLGTAIPRLKARLKEVRLQEEDEKRKFQYDNAKRERDRLAAELASVYPGIAHKLQDLLSRLAENDRQIEYINRLALPRGCEQLLVAELVARKLEGFVQRGCTIPRIVSGTCLPAFRHDEFRPYSWPKPI